jgi:hypothetical protein
MGGRPGVLGVRGEMAARNWINIRIVKKNSGDVFYFYGTCPNALGFPQSRWF